MTITGAAAGLGDERSATDQRPTAGRQAAARLLLALGLLLAATVASGSASASPALPLLAGRTTVVFEGTSGIRLMVPQDVRYGRADITAQFTDGSAAFLIAGPRSKPCRAGFESQAEEPNPWCTDIGVTAMKGWQDSPFVSVSDDTLLRRGEFDMQVVTDGRLTVTLTFEELGNETATYAATGDVAGALSPTPVTCLQQSLVGCRQQGIGAQVLTNVPAGSVVGSAVYAQRTNNLSAARDLPSPGTASAGSCIYPNFFNPDESPEIVDHPTGCDLDEFGPAPGGRQYAINAVNPLLVAVAPLRLDYSAVARARVYTGWNAHQVEGGEAAGEKPGTYAGYSHWMQRGITCPSRDFTAC